MRGVWLTRSAAALANGKGMFVFNRDVVPKLKMKKKSPKSHPLVFLPEDMMLEPYKDTYKDNFVEEDEFSAQVEDVLGDVTNLRRSAIYRPKLRASGSETGESACKDKPHQREAGV